MSKQQEDNSKKKIKIDTSKVIKGKPILIRENRNTPKK